MVRRVWAVHGGGHRDGGEQSFITKIAPRHILDQPSAVPLDSRYSLVVAKRSVEKPDWESLGECNGAKRSILNSFFKVGLGAKDRRRQRYRRRRRRRSTVHAFRIFRTAWYVKMR